MIERERDVGGLDRKGEGDGERERQTDGDRENMGERKKDGEEGERRGGGE